ncbi:branched-chain amino acid transport system II carrier protein [Lapidilactobacillus wuchangensis]|uniref:branched-chain amino acid transport system II carrier protein n=1 Tax=Lapidilactobacillus wuchangensis TaxID=2486001 RepID=UPI000F77D466|nr:branched-chain amino acid transport system II carrier protein [Lapidilactobacillus wuchangensis]
MGKKQFGTRDLIFTGSLLFGLFFGSGNLIFPVALGQSAGANFWPALFGMLLSAVGLPLLGVCAIALTQSNGVLSLANKVGRHFGRIFTIALYLVIGPLFVLPRLADTAFVISFGTVTNSPWWLLLFSLLFLGSAYWLARRPGKLLDYIGKILNPLFLILLALLLGAALINPLGGTGHQPQPQFAQRPISSGFSVGYNTMDLLAALAFGIIIITSLQVRGVTKPKELALTTIKAGVISTGLMAVLYGALTYLGASSVAKFGVQANGALTLALTAHYYFGQWGQVILSAIVIVACLKTAVGLISAFGETFTDLYPQWSYQRFILIATAGALILANLGLNQLIAYSNPVLMLIYPLAITLVLSSLISTLTQPPHYWSYRLAMLFVLIPAILNGLANLPANVLAKIGWLHGFTDLNLFLPFADYGLGWLFPAILGLMVGLLLDNFWDKEL